MFKLAVSADAYVVPPGAEGCTRAEAIAMDSVTLADAAAFSPKLADIDIGPYLTEPAPEERFLADPYGPLGALGWSEQPTFAEELGAQLVAQLAPFLERSAARPVPHAQPVSAAPLALAKDREAFARANFKASRDKGARWTDDQRAELLRQYRELTKAGPCKLKTQRAHELLGEIWDYPPTSIKTFLTGAREASRVQPARRRG